MLFGQVATVGEPFTGTNSGAVRRIEQPLRFILKNTAFNPSAMLVVTAALKRIHPLPVHFRHSQDFIIALRLALSGETICAYDAVVALAPPEDGNRLSRHMAEMFGNMTETVSQEAGLRPFPLPELRYATARYASRCLRYFRRVRRSGRRELSVIEIARLSLIALGARFAPASCCRAALDQIAAVFYRDRAHVLGSARPDRVG